MLNTKSDIYLRTEVEIVFSTLVLKRQLFLPLSGDKCFSILVKKALVNVLTPQQVWGEGWNIFRVVKQSPCSKGFEQMIRGTDCIGKHRFWLRWVFLLCPELPRFFYKSYCHGWLLARCMALVMDLSNATSIDRGKEVRGELKMFTLSSA